MAILIQTLNTRINTSEVQSNPNYIISQLNSLLNGFQNNINSIAQFKIIFGVARTIDEIPISNYQESFITSEEKTGIYIKYIYNAGRTEKILTVQDSFLTIIPNQDSEYIVFFKLYDTSDEQEEEPVISDEPSQNDNINYSQKTLFAKDKTREDFTPSTWSGEGAPTIQELIGSIYPVGSIYITTKNENPGITLGVGTWARIRDAFLWGGTDTEIGSTNYNATTDSDGSTYIHPKAGSKTAVLPSHYHTTKISTTGAFNVSHNHYPAVRNNTGYPTTTRQYAGWVGIMPDKNCSSGQAKDVSDVGLGQYGFNSIAGNGKTLPYSPVNSQYVDFYWSNYTNTVTTNSSGSSLNHVHSIPAIQTDPKGVTNYNTANMPPYLPVYIWRRMS